MASKICLPSLKVVETEKVPRVMVLRKSARFLPLEQEASISTQIYNADLLSDPESAEDKILD